MKKHFLSIVLAVVLGGILRTFAGDPGDDASKQTAPPATPAVPAFRAGAQEVELLSGPMFSLQGGNPRDRPVLDYALEAIRYGWMLNDVHGSSFLRGNDELLLEGFGGEVFRGPGSGLGGGALVLRHNFVQDGSRLVPYIQLGGGGLDNNIYRDQIQRRIGEAFEFTLEGALGVRWMINDRLSVITEAEYRHISNADLAARNAGLDSIGATLGLNFLF